jgi:protein disulfide-isomerase A1
VGDEVVSIDCSTEAKFCQESDVASFPAIRLQYPDSKKIRYRGPRKTASIRAFLDRTRRPAVSSVNTENATAFQSSDDVVFIGHFGPRDTKLQQSFTLAAEKYRDRYSFAIATAQQQQGPTVECYNNPDNIKRSTAEFSRPTLIESFIKLCSTPLIPELTRRNELSFYQVSVSFVGKGPWPETMADLRRHGRALSITLCATKRNGTSMLLR